MRCPPGEGHGKGLDGHRLEVEDAGVEVDGAQGARGDDHALELGEHGLHRKASIQATELHQSDPSTSKFWYVISWTSASCQPSVHLAS